MFKKMKKIGLTYDVKTDSRPRDSDPHDAQAEFDHPATINILVRAIESNGYKVVRIGNADKLLEKLSKLKVDLVFNLSEGMYGRNRESQVPILLEMAGIPYVGSDALTLGMTLDKIIAKKIFISDGIPTPKFFQIRNIEELVNADHCRFPLIVKPRFEGSSKGLSESSRVTNMDELHAQVKLVLDTYKQDALVEEFIRGSEFTVAIVGNDPPEALPSVQVKIDGRLKLNDKFYTFARISSRRLEYVCPARISRDQEKELRELALKAYQAVECRDFGRVDFRIDKDGNLYVLEINPLPSLSTEDVFMLLAKQKGITYRKMIGMIIECALKRHNLN